MKATISNMIAVAGLMIAGGAMAADMPDLAKKYGCTNCHKIDKKLVGPAWQAVADKYKGDAAAADALSTKIVKVAVEYGVLCRCPPPQRSPIRKSRNWSHSFWAWPSKQGDNFEKPTRVGFFCFKIAFAV